jgi:pimeloyl-ACP methyl ester carboxylesterase
VTITRGYLDLPGGQLHFRRAGTGGETIVLLHQTASSSAMYERFMDLLVDKLGPDAYTLLALDTPGFGMSYRPRERYSITAWAQDFLATASELGIGRFHVLGHHTGAAIAARMAAEAPERIDSLAMIGALAMDPAERESWLRGIRGMELDDGGGHMATVWQQVNTIDGDPHAFPPNLELRHREAVDKLLAGQRWHEAYEAVFSADVAADLARVQCPVLLFCGSADVLAPYVGPTLAARPGTRYVPLDAGAYVLDQAPEQVLGPYVEFLEAKEAA